MLVYTTCTNVLILSWLESSWCLHRRIKTQKPKGLWLAILSWITATHPFVLVLSYCVTFLSYYKMDWRWQFFIIDILIDIVIDIILLSKLNNSTEKEIKVQLHNIFCLIFLLTVEKKHFQDDYSCRIQTYWNILITWNKYVSVTFFRMITKNIYIQNSLRDSTVKSHHSSLYTLSVLSALFRLMSLFSQWSISLLSCLKHSNYYFIYEHRNSIEGVKSDKIHKSSFSEWACPWIS